MLEMRLEHAPSVGGRILVTGPQGFAGSNLVAQLGNRALPTEVDVTDAESVAEAVRTSSSGAIVHLAAVVLGDGLDRDPGEAWRVNVVGAVNVLGAARSHAPEARVLMLSTGEVYGRADQVDARRRIDRADLAVRGLEGRCRDRLRARAAQGSTSSWPARSSTRALAGTSGLRSDPGRLRSHERRRPAGDRARRRSLLPA